MKELRKKSISDLNKLLIEKKESLRSLRFSLNEKQLKDTSRIPKIKKEIARIKMLISNHES
jgi:ribosomal protein L29